MHDLLRIVRWLGLAGVLLSIPAVGLAALALIPALARDSGDNGLGDAIALTVGVVLLIFGSAGLIFGGLIAVLAKRSLADRAEIRGPRRIVLAAGLAVAAGQVLISAALGGPLLIFVGLSASFAAAFLVVAAASRRRGDLFLAGILALVVLALGVIPLGFQASQRNRDERRAERAALIPADMTVAIDAAADAAPDGWAVATIAFGGTNLGIPSVSRDLRTELMGQPLRGLLAVDCAGSQGLEVVTTLDDSRAVVPGSIPCQAETQIVPFEIPGVTDHPGVPDYVQRIYIFPVPDEGATGVMYRTMILVGLAGTPDPAPDAIRAAFVAAFGTEKPR